MSKYLISSSPVCRQYYDQFHADSNKLHHRHRKSILVRPLTPCISFLLIYHLSNSPLIEAYFLSSPKFNFHIPTYSIFLMDGVIDRKEVTGKQVSEEAKGGSVEPALSALRSVIRQAEGQRLTDCNKSRTVKINS